MIKSKVMSIPYIDIHTHHPFPSEDILFVQSFFLQEVDSLKNFPFTAGIHPWHAESFSPDKVLEMLGKLLIQTNLVAIGETGLDKKSKAEFKNQIEIFEIHLEYAQMHQLPLIIHNVGSWNEIMNYNKNSEIPFILHGYQGNLELTRQLLNGNFYFSFGKSLIKNELLQKVIKQIPANLLFFETDDLYLDIHEIYGFAAPLLNYSPEGLGERVFSNFNNVFKIDI